MSAPQVAADVLADVVRTERRRVLATLVRTLGGDLQLAEDAVQDAAVAALRTWPERGVPDDPRAWLTTTARHRALDVLRREAKRSGKEAAVQPSEPEPAPTAGAVDDDLLRLVFTCCHPALSLEARVALALRTLAGLTVPEIAAAMLVEEAAMAKRLVRVRRKIADARIPYRVPTDAELPARLPAVLAVVHLVYTCGHAPVVGEAPVRVDLCEEAVRLARLLVALMPAESEVTALLALLLLTDARRPARTGPDGAAVLMADQDRSRWDAAALREGAELLQEAARLGGGGAGAYLLQARLAACHSLAATWADTPWPTVVGLYDRLLEQGSSPALLLNRAVAVGELHGPAAQLEALDQVPEASRSHLWHAARAEALGRLGRAAEAVHALETAHARATGAADRRLLADRLAQSR